MKKILSKLTQKIDRGLAKLVPNFETHSGPWHPYTETSIWNTKIVKAVEYDENSQALIDDLSTSSPLRYITVNLGYYSIPVYYIDGSTPMRAVNCRLAAHNFPKKVPIPDNAVASPGTDRHISIIDLKKGIEYGMWNAVKSADGSWTCSLGAISNLRGSGVRPPHTVCGFPKAHGARASGFGLVAGLITVDEIKSGHINHVLAFAYPHCRSKYYMQPASTAQRTNGIGAQPNRGIPMGGHIQLDPNINVDKLPLTEIEKIIARALQEYGAFISDYSGALSLYFDNSPAAIEKWSQLGINGKTLVVKVMNDIFIRKHFKVIKFGELYEFGQ